MIRPTRRQYRGRRLVGALGATLAVLGVAGLWPFATAPAAATSKAGPVWLCEPGMAANPCADSSGVTAMGAGGTQTVASWPRSRSASAFDCFYVYPTVSREPGGNADLAVTTAEKAVAVSQAAPFTNVCEVWAPVYRSQTWKSVQDGLAGNRTLLRSTFAVAYRSLLSTWQSFLAHDDDGKPVVLIGDSQGAALLIHLVASRLDHEAGVRHRLVAAILVGGNLQVPTDRTVGATFTKVPLCTRATETGCAIAFSAYPSEPPADSVFGRPGQGVSVQSGQTRTRGEQVACVNPAAIAGGAGTLSPYELTVTQHASPPVPTPWVTYPDLYRARCRHGGGATWLQVTSQAGPGDARPIVNEDVLGPTWGYHLDEFALTVGNLLRDVAREEAAWPAHH